MSINYYLKHSLLLLLLTILFACNDEAGEGDNGNGQENSELVHFVFVSDSHYGLTRQFDGETRTAEYVNTVMVDMINKLPGSTLPDDGGIGADCEIGAIEMVINGGDIANRSEKGIQGATTSWSQFETSFIGRLQTKNGEGRASEIFVIPGNHDVSNCIGHYKMEEADRDAGSLTAMYNLMSPSGQRLTAAQYNYGQHRIYLGIERFGIRFLFINIWPGEEARTWMSTQVTDDKPALIFAHDPPAIDYKHMTNPVPPHGVDEETKYENLIPDMPSKPGSSLNEQRDFALWLNEYPSVKAYFHGHNNWNEFYVFTGPDNNTLLPTFRVDSPMKGTISANDQSHLSFHVVTVDTAKMEMTVRECFWARGDSAGWGASRTVIF